MCGDIQQTAKFKIFYVKKSPVKCYLSNLICLLPVNFYCHYCHVVDSKEKLQINLGIHKVKSGHNCDIMY